MAPRPLETTGVDVECERVVTAALVRIAPNHETQVVNRLVDPGVPIPDGAAAIHGITTAHAATHGEAPHIVLFDVCAALADAIRLGVPIVGMNLVYDLTLLDRECRRHDIPTLSDTFSQVRPMVDVLVLDKAMDQYRKGSRKLTALCEHYGVTLDQGHNSGADALASCRVAFKLAQRYPELQTDLNRLHDQQISWAAEQRASFAAHRQHIGQPLDAAETDGTWPIRPHKTQ